MPTYYVDSGAPGPTRDGTSWTNAWLTILSGLNVAAGDIIKVHKAHVEGISSSIIFTNGTRANPIRIVSVDKDSSDALSAGANIAITSTTPSWWGGNAYVYGINSYGTGAATPYIGSTTADEVVTLVNCAFSGTTSNSVPVRIGNSNQAQYFKNCLFSFRQGAAGQDAAIGIDSGPAFAILSNCTFVSKSDNSMNYLVKFNTANAGKVIFQACDFSTFNVDTSAAFFNGIRQNLYFYGCKFPSTVGPIAGDKVWSNISSLTNTESHILIVNSDRDTISTMPYTLVHYGDIFGSIDTEVSIWRTSGANDGVRNYSWKLISTANVGEYGCRLETPYICKFTAPGSGTLTVYIGSAVTLQNDECYLEITYPDETPSPNISPQYSFQSNAAEVTSTPSDLTTDSVSTWNGSYGGTKQKITMTIVPQVSGLISAKLILHKASTTIYLDPYLDTSF